MRMDPNRFEESHNFEIGMQEMQICFCVLRMQAKCEMKLANESPQLKATRQVKLNPILRSYVKYGKSTENPIWGLTGLEINFDRQFKKRERPQAP